MYSRGWDGDMPSLEDVAYRDARDIFNSKREKMEGN